jgi:mono/diheme cytochrome c family protein
MMPHRVTDRFLLASVFVIGFAATAAAQAQRQDQAADKAPDDGAKAATQLCAGVCHGADHFGFSKKTPDQWRITVLQMVSNGAQLSPEEIATVTKYFATNLSTSTPAAATK